MYYNFKCQHFCIEVTVLRCLGAHSGHALWKLIRISAMKQKQKVLAMKQKPMKLGTYPGGYFLECLHFCI